MAVGEALRRSAFWIMVGVFFLVTASVHACFIHLPAILTDRGSTAQMAALASSLLEIGVFLGGRTPTGGGIARRVNKVSYRKSAGSHFTGESSNTTPALRLPPTEVDPNKSPTASRSKPPDGPEPFSPLKVRSVVLCQLPLDCGERRNTMPIPKRPSLAFP